MNLSDILALRPQGTDAASFRDALTRAEDAQRQAASTVAQLTRKAASSLLTADDDEMMRTEAALTAARLTVDRLAMLVPEILTGLADAIGREERQARQSVIEIAIAADADFVAVWNKHFAGLAEKAALILRAKEQADAAIQDAASLVELPRHAAFPHPLPGRVNPIELVLTLAALAPSEIKRAAEAEAERAKAHDARVRAEKAEYDARLATGRKLVEQEQADWRRQQDAKREPNGFSRAPIRIAAV